MTEVVSKMRGELRDILRDSVVDYTTKARDKWLFDWPGQIILVVNQVFWCQEVEQVCLGPRSSRNLRLLTPDTQPVLLGKWGHKLGIGALFA